jgi:CrcB protein
MTLVYVALGGALGSVARYVVADRVGAWANSGAFGIFVVNIVGSFLIGLFLQLGEDRFELSFHTRVLVATGFLGGFTTFSTLTWQTYGLVDVRDYAGAALNIAATIVLGMAAVYAGVGVARAVS